MKLAVKLNPAWRRTLAISDRRTWFLRSAALRIQPGSTVWELEFYWKRLLVLFCVSAVGGYLALTTALWQWWDRNPHNQVGWTDIARAPLDWEGLRKKRGDTAILQALEQVRKEEYVEAIYGLRVGLARSPGNLAGRLALARLLSGGNPAQSLSILEAGIPFAGSDEEFFRTLFSFYAHHGAKARAVEQAGALLAAGRQPVLSADARLCVELGLAAAALDLGNAPRALAILDESQPLSEEDRKRHRRLHFSGLLRTGKFDAARLLLGKSDAVMNAAEIAGGEADLALAMSDTPAFRIATQKLLATSPQEPGVYLYALRGWHQLKQPAERDAVEIEFYERFGARDAALQLMAATAVNLSLPDVVRRAERAALRNRLSTFAFRVHQTEILLRAGAYPEALKQVIEWEPQLESVAERQRFYPAFIAQLAHAASPGTDATGAGLLGQLVQSRPPAQPAVFELAGATLVAAKQEAAARDVVETGLRLYPGNDALLQLRATLGERPAALVAAAELAPRGTRPSEAVDARAQTNAAPDEFAAQAASSAAALSALDRWVETQDLREADRFLSYLNRRTPSWLSEARSEIAVREVGVRLALGQRPLAIAAFRDLIQRAGAPRAMGFNLVRDAHARGDSDTTAYLAREIARLLPNDPAAIKLAEEIK